MKVGNWIAWCFRHTRLVLLALALIFISGTIAYIVVPKESTPDIKIPLLYISAKYEGISPNDAERLILRPLEQHLRSLEGLKTITSKGFEGGGDVILEFLAGYDINKAQAKVREKVDTARQDLPKDMRTPTIHEINLGLMPVLIVMLSGEVPERTLFKLSEQLKEAIESQIPAVLEAKIIGNRKEQVEILVSPEKIETYQVSFDEIFNFFLRNNVMVSAGRLMGEQGQFSLRVPGLLETAQDVMELPIISERDAAVRLKDIALIRRSLKDAESTARNFGVKTVSLEISKRTGENVINTIAAVRQVVERESRNWPESVKIKFAQDDSARILNMVKDLKNHLISAVLLVMVVVIFSLGARSALLVGISIPGSFLAGILLIGLMGFTINIVVLFGLILSIGMLVDGAIIVVEYADRKMAEGMSAAQAYGVAAQRMLWPVVTSISTILVVFFPLIFWPGVVGEFMKYLPYTLLSTLGASLVMALIFVPTLGSIFGKLSPKHMASIETIQVSESGDLNKLKGLTSTYYRLLDRALSHPKKVVFGAVGLLFSVVFIYGFLGKGIEFFPDVEPDSAAVLVRARGNLSLAEKDLILQQVENRLLDMKEFRSLYGTTDLEQRFGPEVAEDVIGKIALEFEDWQKRRPVKVILEDVTQRVASIPGIYTEIQKEGGGPGQGKPIQLELSGMEFGSMIQSFNQLKAYMASLPGIINLEDNLPIPGITWELKVDRARAVQLGADIMMIGNTIKLVTNGVVVSTYRPNDQQEEIDIVVRFDKSNRTLDALDRLQIKTKQGMIPLSTVVTRQAEPRLSMVHRVDGRRVLSLKADVKDGFLAHDLIASIRSWIDTHIKENGIIVNFRGEEADKGETSRFLGGAFMAAILLMTAILVTQFNSFFSTFLILSSVVMATIGVFIGLMVMQMPFSIVMCGIGVIALAGIIVSNNIILIDTFDQLAKITSSKREAILRTGVQRLRPVILTKLTAILGLLPIMFRLDIDYISLQLHFGSPSTMWWQQIAISIVFGVAFASVLTLLVTPCALMLRENFRLKKLKNP